MRVILIVVDTLRTIPKGFVKGQEKKWKLEDNIDHPDNSIIKIGQNTEKSPGDLLWLKLQWETIS